MTTTTANTDAFVKFHQSFWDTDTARKLRKHSRDALTLAIFLKTSPKANVSGLYAINKGIMSAYTGMPTEVIDSCLAVIEACGFARYDDASETVWVIDAAASISELKTTDNNVKYLQKTFDAVPADCPFLDAFFARYCAQLKLKPHASKAPVTPAPAAAKETVTATPAPKVIQVEMELNRSAVIERDDVAAAESMNYPARGEPTPSVPRETLEEATEAFVYWLKQMQSASPERLKRVATRIAAVTAQFDEYIVALAIRSSIALMDIDLDDLERTAHSHQESFDFI